MRMTTLLVAFLALVLAGCAANPPTELSPSVVSAPSVEQSAPVAQPTMCAGRSWPPYQLGTIPGVTATSTSRATLQVTNRTERTYYYRVAGWQPAQFETCTALGAEEIEEGPIARGATVQIGIAAFADRIEVPITIALWAERCGEGCQRDAPIAAMLVERSPLEPASS